jgi:isoquinoline 1-oxidoreductase alpha subunit
MPLLWVLRDCLGLTGTKFGCGSGLCGACTVHANGVAVRACITPAGNVSQQFITTIEGIGGPVADAVQRAWRDLDAVQCGYCQSGQIMQAIAMLRDNPSATDSDIEIAMNGNVCRCGTYPAIRAAIHQAARDLRAGQ